MATPAQFKIEDVAPTPRGYRVRTLVSGAHRIRVAFPPGPRRKGSGKLVQVLHPREENPKQCNPGLLQAAVAGTAAGAAAGTMATLTAKALGKKNPQRCANASVEAWLDQAERARQAGKFEKAAALEKIAMAQEKREEAKEAKGRYQRSRDRRNPKQCNSPAFGSQALRGLLRSNPSLDSYRIAMQRMTEADLAELANTFRLARLLVGKRGLTAEQAYETATKISQLAVKELKQRQANTNPNGNGAAHMYADFHGRAPSEVIRLQEALLTSGDYTALGNMGSLWLEPVKGEPSRWPAPSIEFEKKDNVKLVTDAAGKQLYLVGGNQELPLDYLRRKGIQTGKRFITLGEVYAVSYLTEKSFDGFRHTEYAHEFGEKTGERPFAYYDAELERIVMVGGGYSIADPTDALGASPGIVN